MKQTYPFLIGAFVCLCTLPARAQYQFKNVADATSQGLAPYVQSFDLPAATTVIGCNADGSSKNFAGVYARFTVDGDASFGEYPAGFNFTATPSSIPAGDGTNAATAWYHFGAVASLERALGGIGGAITVNGTTYPSGVGYVGVRLKNGSTVTIKNLEIKYALEQWYNSSREQAAATQVHYMRTTRSGTGPAYTYTPLALTTLIGTGWTEIQALKIDAPSTTVPIEERNGNAATNRRVAQTTLADINLLPGEEIMIRFNYVFNAASNGNGLSIDDLVITPQTNVFYSTATGDLDDLDNWGIAANGTGTHPTSFTSANQTFYVQGANATVNRVQRGTGWTVSGENSKIIVGIPASPAIGNVAARAAAPGALLVSATNKTITAPIDVAEGSILRIDDVNSALTLGSLATTSTVEYSNTAGTHLMKPASYGNLKLSGTGAKALGSDVIINGTLNLNNESKLTLGAYDATLLRPAINVGSYTGSVLNAGTTAYIVTSGVGRLRQSVPSSGVNVFFPVGTAASYTPVKMKQSASTSEDMYGVRVIDGTYVKYTAAEAGVTGTTVSYQNVKKTWLIDEEVSGSSNVTMTLQWNKTDATADFVPAKAHINHYVGNGVSGGWDNNPATLDFATVATDVYSVARAGITSFSPFAISSRAGGVLPVELTAFEAKRTADGVLSRWSTASEKNNDHFTLERSLDSRSFHILGSIQGQGSSTQAHHYSYLDTQPITSVSYYRLQQVDADGQVSYSPVVTVEGCPDCALAASIAPNPGTGRFELRTNLPTAAAVQATVLSVVGRPVLTQTLAVAAGIQRTPLDLSGQPAGIYLVRLAAPSGLATLRVVKQ